MTSIDQINAFLKVYELQGYSAAATQLEKGRTTVRELVLTLEQQLDIQLFEVVGRQVRATESAQRIYPHAKLVQSQLISFSGLMESLHEVQESHLTVHHDAMLPDAMMLEITSKLYDKFPHLQITWSQSGWQNAIDIVANNETQIAFLANKTRRFSDPRVQVKFLGFNDFAIFVGKNSTLSLVESSELRNNVQLIPKSMLEQGINGYTCFANNYISLNSNDEVCRLLKKLGWAMLPIADVQQYVQRGDIKQMSPGFMFNDLKMSMAAYYRPAVKHGPVMSYLLSLLPEISQQYFS